MSVFTFDAKAGNPVTAQSIQSLGKEFGITEKNERDLNDYKTLLAVFHDVCEEIMAMEDYIPGTNLERFPRTGIYRPTEENNRLGAWGWKVTIKDIQPTDKDLLLKNKTVVVKDCVSIAGVPMLLGTDFIQNYTPNTDATIVTRLLEAGAVIVGKGVCENLCHSATSHSAGTGPVQNPYAVGYSSGGSSSGPAALVADPIEHVDIGIGVDNGGSVRIPAAWSGCYGIKPTFGLIPFTGCATNEATNDHFGIITRDVLTNAKCLQVISGTDNIDDRGYNVKGLNYFEMLTELKNPTNLKGFKIGILKEGFQNQAIEERVRAICMDAIRKLESLGATAEEVSVPLHSKGTLIWTGISKVGGYLTKVGCAIGRRGYSINDLGEKLVDSLHNQDRWDQAYPSSKNIYYNGAYAVKKFPLVYGKCTNLSRKLRDDYDKVLEEYDVIVMPTVPFVARSHAAIDKTSSPLDYLGKQVGLSSNTAPFNQTGHPALALPCGMLPLLEGPLADIGTEVPVSLQIVGKWYDEPAIYKIAYAWEQSYDWKDL